MLPEGVRIDVFPQSQRAQIDALFVVDNSKYMAVHQQRVADSFHRFVDYLDRNNMDYHLGLVPADVDNFAATYVGAGQRGYFAAGDSDLPTKVAAAVLALGTTSPRSASLQQSDLSLHGAPDGFLRAGAALFVVAVTDNDDIWSPGEDLYYFRTFKESKGAGNDALVKFSAVAGPLPAGCSVPDPANPQNTFFAQPAVRLARLAAQTGGDAESLCDPDFDAVFDKLGAAAAGLKRAFRLSLVPDLTTLAVTVDAPCDARRDALSFCGDVSDQCNASLHALACTPRADAWSYDAATNSILFAQGAVPPRGSQVEAQYKEAAK